MALGCNFICDNLDCEHYDKVIVLTGPWPMCSIDQMVVLMEKEGHDDHVNYLKDLQQNERQFSCLTLPNAYDVETQAYRIQKWCGKCNLISVFEVEPEEVEEVSEGVDTCMSCESEVLVNFVEATTDGIECPFCNTKMKQNRWYSNEEAE